MTYPSKALFLLVAALVLPLTSVASPVAWNLSGVTFSDGATATGTMTWDADSHSLSNWNLSVTAGNLPAFTYNSSDSTAGNYFQVSGYQNEFLFMANGSTRQLRMTPVAALTNAGGAVDINLNTWGRGSGSTECFNCAPYRSIVSGDFTTLATSTPEPGPLGLLGISFASISLLARMRRRKF